MVRNLWSIPWDFNQLNTIFLLSLTHFHWIEFKSIKSAIFISILKMWNFCKTFCITSGAFYLITLIDWNIWIADCPPNIPSNSSKLKVKKITQTIDIRSNFGLQQLNDLRSWQLTLILFENYFIVIFKCFNQIKYHFFLFCSRRFINLGVFMFFCKSHKILSP